MTSYPQFRIYEGDAFTRLKELDRDSIDCIVTSPPYWQKRDNGVTGQIGLEDIYTDYLEKLWQVFAEVKRVLKPCGTCWVVIDDTSNGNKKGNTNGITTSRGSGTVKQKRGLREFGTKGVNKKTQPGVPQYSLLQIPHRFSIGMTDRLGWLLSNDISWYKPNGQPNTAKKRCMYGYDERVLLFVKDHEKLAFTVPLVPSRQDMSKLIDAHQVWEIPTEQSELKHYSSFPIDLCNRCIYAGCPEGGVVLDPFMGSGTTGISTLKNKRHFIGIDISPEYVAIAEKRLMREFDFSVSNSDKENENDKNKTFTLDDF
ncbi:MAG: DNA-methyltransferase [Clostridia bacterium]